MTIYIMKPQVMLVPLNKEICSSKTCTDLHTVVIGVQQSLFISRDVDWGHLNVRLRIHFVPLFLHAEEYPLEATQDLQGHDCEHSQVVATKMGWQLVRPCAP